MRHEILSICIALVMLCVGISAKATIASGTCGGKVKWELYNDYTLSISGKGDMKNWESETKVPWYSNQTKITKVVIIGDVTSIGDYAFTGCTKMTSMSISNCIKK